MKKLLLILLLAISSVSYGGTIDPNKSDSEYVQYGLKHKCVAKIAGRCKDKNDNFKDFFASSVIIKPRIVLTAAHVVDEAKDIYIVDHDDNHINVQSAFYLNEWNNNIVGANDIAVCLLEKNVDIDFYPKLYEQSDEIGKICSVSGFGITGNYIKGSEISDGQQRAGSNIIDEIFNGMLVTSVNIGKKTSLEFLISHGDSGGGLFIDNKLAGINSGIMTEDKDKNLNSDYKDFAAHTRISLHKAWIESIIEKIEKFIEDKRE